MAAQDGPAGWPRNDHEAVIADTPTPMLTTWRVISAPAPRIGLIAWSKRTLTGPIDHTVVNGHTLVTGPIDHTPVTGDAGRDPRGRLAQSWAVGGRRSLNPAARS